MVKMIPEQEALYALHWNVPRSELSMAAQLEYDRLRPAWERGETRPAAGELEAARLAWEGSRTRSRARPVAGDEIRDTTFLIIGGGYDMAQVDDLLRRIAVEIDAERPIELLIKNVSFRRREWTHGYDIQAVHWFLEQLRLDHRNPAGMTQDPWRDLAVTAQFTRTEIGDLAGGFALPSWLAVRKDYSQEYRKALLWATWRNNLRTMEKETIASLSSTGRSVTLSAARRKFTLRAISTRRPPPPGVDAIAARSFRDFEGHFAAETTGSQIGELSA